MVNKFKVSAEAVGAAVKIFASLTDAVNHAKKVANSCPMSASFLPPEIEEAFEGTVFVSPPEAADAGFCISYAQAGIASTGTILLDLSQQQGRASTALSTVHVVFLKASTIVEDLYALQDQIAEALTSSSTAYLSLTTGPSRTADIERVLTIGVHGPRELHILLLEGE